MRQHPAYKERDEDIIIDVDGFGDPNYVNELSQKISQRKADMSSYTGHRGIITDALFTDNEIKGLVNTWESGTVGQKVALSTFLVEQFPDNAVDVFADIAPKDAVFSQLGYLTGNALSNQATPDYLTQLTTLVDQGQEIERLKANTYAMGKPKEEALYNILGDSYNNNPGAKQQLIKTADYIYYALNESNPSTFSKSDYQQAIQMASGQIEKYTFVPDPLNVVNGVEQMQKGPREIYGGIVTHNRQKLAIPTQIKQSAFSDMIEDAKLEDFQMALSDRNGNPYNFAPTDDAPQFTLDQYQNARLQFLNSTTASLSAGKEEGLISNIRGFDRDAYSRFQTKGGEMLYVNYVLLHSIMNKRYPGKY